jgi:hypothetical protein
MSLENLSMNDAPDVVENICDVLWQQIRLFSTYAY